MDLINKLLNISKYLRSVNSIPYLFYVNIERSCIKTTTLEWTLNSPMSAHTFTVPPFYITTGKHYTQYRQGCNILQVCKNIDYNIFNRSTFKTSNNYIC